MGLEDDFLSLYDTLYFDDTLITYFYCMFLRKKVIDLIMYTLNYVLIEN